MKPASWTACALTLGNLLCGFAAIVLGVQGYAQQAYFNLVPAEVVYGAWLLFLGMLLDGLDGRVARMAKADGAFGTQLDSLADMVSFGLAPAVLAWIVGTRAGLPGALLWAAGALYAAAAALRLARYNVQHASPRLASRNPDFEGLPSPAAAGLVAGLILLAGDPVLAPAAQKRLLQLLPGAAAAAGVLMVSRVSYVHLLNRLGRRGFAPLKWVAGLGLLASLALYPAMTVAVGFGGYALAGLAWGTLGRFLPREAEEAEDLADQRLFPR